MGNAVTALLLGGSGGLIAGIILGALLVGGFQYFQSGGVGIPYAQDHVDIAHNFAVAMDTRDGKIQLDIKHIQTSTFTYAQDVLNEHFVMKKGEVYTESLWAWCSSGNDVEVAMTIIGPSNGSYTVEFGKVSFAPIYISGYGLHADWPGGETEGFAHVDVKP